MSRASRLWLTGAAAVIFIVLAVVVVFGIRTLPAFPNLYEGGPTVEGTVAYVTQDRDSCLEVLDVASGTTREVYCADWVWLVGWDDDGNLRVDSGTGVATIIDPATGTAVGTSDDFTGPHPRYDENLHTFAREGHVTLTYTGSTGEVTLIDAEGPRGYAFREQGITSDGQYAWVCDSEGRLLVAALDGSSGPWLVAEDIDAPAWR